MPLKEDHSFLCPYCSQENTLEVDLTAGARQQFVVDCEVCCSPIAVRLHLGNSEILSVEINRENG